MLQLKRPRCPECVKGFKGNYSLVSLRWLSDLEKHNAKYTIQHTKNGGEKRIFLNKKIIQVDGYCKKTNTVFEFLGSPWHGNPEKYRPDEKCNPHSKRVTAKDLFKKKL